MRKIPIKTVRTNKNFLDMKLILKFSRAFIHSKVFENEIKETIFGSINNRLYT